MWHDPHGKTFTLDDLVSLIKETNPTVSVGTDSQLMAGRWVIATVICLYHQGQGGRFFFKREKAPKEIYKDLKMRLLDEVAKSVNVGWQIRNLLPNTVINIHADVASNEEHASNCAAKDATHYITGMGFVPKIKPDSWAASAVADKILR